MDINHSNGSLHAAGVRAGAGVFERRVGREVILEFFSRRTVGIPLKPFQLVRASDSDGLKVRVVSSTIAGKRPDVFNLGDTPIYTIEVSESGIVWATVEVDPDTGLISTVGIANGTVAPDDPEGQQLNYIIGTYSVIDDALSVSNDAYGPLSAVVCGSTTDTFVVTWRGGSA